MTIIIKEAQCKITTRGLDPSKAIQIRSVKFIFQPTIRLGHQKEGTRVECFRGLTKECSQGYRLAIIYHPNHLLIMFFIKSIITISPLSNSRILLGATGVRDHQVLMKLEAIISIYIEWTLNIQLCSLSTIYFSSF